MRIGITCYPTYGGSGALATELGKQLAMRGHEIHFITSALPYRLQVGFREGIYFHEVKMRTYPLFEYEPYALALASKMKEIFEEARLDLLHVHYAMPHAVSAFLAAKMLAPEKVPVVTTLHGTDITIVGQEKSFFDITRLGINESCVVTAVSDYLKTETEKVFYPEKKILRIYNFADPELFKPAFESRDRRVFAGDDQVIYLHISNFRRVKRIADVIRTFHRVQKEVDAVLLLAGEGEELGEAKALVKALEIQPRVRFLGKQEDIVTFLNIADVMLFPSEMESFGLAALEAMACEVPVVACNSGGVPEVITHGECGFLERVGDVEGLARRAVQLGQSEYLRSQMGAAGRKRAVEHFHPDIILPQYEKVYREAIDCCSGI